MGGSRPVTKESVASGATGKQREEESRRLPPPGSNLEFDWPDTEQVRQVVDDGYHVLTSQAVPAFGGTKRLTIALGRAISYESKISEGLRREGDRRLHVDAFFALLTSPTAAPPILDFVTSAVGAKWEPVIKVQPEELLDSLLAELEEANGVGKAIVERAAKRIRTDAGAYRRRRR